MLEQFLRKLHKGPRGNQHHRLQPHTAGPVTVSNATHRKRAGLGIKEFPQLVVEQLAVPNCCQR